jgi:CRP/FNR family transcriptional regulator
MSNIKSFLADIDPFKGLPMQELDQVAAMALETHHAKGETIFLEGDEAESIWILYQGRIEILKYTSDGKPRAIEVINPKDLFGTLCRVGGTGKSYPCTAVASEDSISYRIPEKLFFNLFEKYPAMVQGVCTMCSYRLNLMQELTCSSQEPVEKRIVRTLLQLSKQHGDEIPFTKRQIGELAATTVETTIRTLSKYQKKNWVASSRGKIYLKDLDKLEAILN